MIRNFTSGLLALSLAAVAAVGNSSLHAAVIDIPLEGATSHDRWHTLTSLRIPGHGSFPGTTMWSPVDSNVGDDAVLKKVSNGTGGGAYAASGSIYFGGTGGPNTYGGTLAAAEDTPLADLKTVVLQLEIGEASGYDLYDDPVNGTAPVLFYKTAAGGEDLISLGGPTFTHLIDQQYNGTFEAPTGTEPLYLNTWGFQWDLSSITDPITSFEIQFAGAQHAQLYGLQLDQSDVAYNVAVVPEPSTWSLLFVVGVGTVVLLRRKPRLA